MLKLRNCQEVMPTATKCDIRGFLLRRFEDGCDGCVLEKVVRADDHCGTNKFGEYEAHGA